MIHSLLNNKNHSCFAIWDLFSQEAYCRYTNNSAHLIKKLLTNIQVSTQQIPLFLCVLSSVPHIVKKVGSWTTSLRLYLESVYNSTWYTPHQLPVVYDIIQLEEFTLFVSRSNYHPAQPTTPQLPFGRGFIQLSSICCNCIRIYPPAKLSRALILYVLDVS